MPQSPVFKGDLLNRFTIPLSGTKFTKVQMIIFSIKILSASIIIPLSGTALISVSIFEKVFTEEYLSVVMYYNGIFPCFFRGFLSTFVFSISSARINFALVWEASITSSI